MAKGMSLDVKVNQKDMDRILTKCSPQFLEGPVRSFFDEIGQVILEAEKVGAPVDTGELRASLGVKVERTAWPLAKVVVEAGANRGGFSYPAALEESPKYHFRSGPRIGQQTRGWFSRPLKDKLPTVRDYLKQLGSDIRKKWDQK